MFARRHSLSFITAIAVAMPFAAQATEWELALDGTDPVAYFDDSAYMQGTKTYAVMWRGQEWRFANADHRDAFEADPFAYLPAYDGQCAACLAKGRNVQGNPAVWTIINGQLYLNFSEPLGELWVSDYDALRPVADAQWDAAEVSSDR